MVNLNIKYLNNFINDSDMMCFEESLKKAHEKLHYVDNFSNGKGWLNLPDNYKVDEISRIKSVSEKIRKQCEVLIVIGIGGSYLGACAAIEFLKSKRIESAPKVIFAGNNMSSHSIQQAIDVCKDKEVCLNVVSKSGSTLECALAFRILRKVLEEKYGKEEAAKRIYCTTDAHKGCLLEIAKQNGYETFEIPTDIGGRYSVLTAVGLLPLSVVGIDIDKILHGVSEAKRDFSLLSLKNVCYKYAVLRNALYKKGKLIEIIAGYEPRLHYFFEWWKQLFGESEGKCGKGIFPSSLMYTSDLHSMGQFMQEGNPIFFETILTVDENDTKVIIPSNESNIDNLNYLAGKTVDYVNHAAFEATIEAHYSGGVPNIHLSIGCMDEYNFGYLIYFFQKACAISAYMLGVDPFNQPGVEAYKTNMFKLLGRP